MIEEALTFRHQLVAGNAEPDEQELKDWGEEAAAAAAGRGTGVCSGPTRGVPLFWLTALCNEVVTPAPPAAAG